VQVYPNPYMEKLNVNFVSEESGKAEIRLVNAAGQVASSKENVITKGYNNFQMNNLNTVAPGIYTADLVINGKTVATQKLIKQ
jgi:Secretion system C-terminal sorting domain